MSGSTPKGPERPAATSSAPDEPIPLYEKSGIKLEGKYAKIVMIILCVILAAMFVIFWYYRGALSSMMIWYVFVQCLFLLFQFITTDIFAAFEASAGGGGNTPTTPQPPSPTSLVPIINCTLQPKLCNGSNGSNSTLFYGPTYEQKYLAY